MNARLPLFAAAAALIAPASAVADVRHSIDLDAGPLAASVVALSRATGASIRVGDAGLWQRKVPAVQGRLTVNQALHRMLAGSGAHPERIGTTSWQIAADPRRAAPPPSSVEEKDANPIVVSASKRGTLLRDFPGTVSILSGADFATGGPTDSDSLASRVSSVTSTHLGAGRDKLFIRGVADSGLVGQSQATVGQYLGDVRLTYNAPDPDLKLYDVASVEVLEGPQGTLYGAGSPGGIIRIVRRDPVLDRFEGGATLGASTVAHGAAGVDGSATLNLPIVDDHAALRIVGYASSDGGYIDNLTTGQKNINRVHTEGGRAMFRLAPGDGWTIDVGGTAQNIHGDDSQYADRDSPSLTRHSTIAQPYDDNYRMGELNIAKDLGDLHFTISGALIRQTVDERFDATVTPGDYRLFRQRNHTTLASTESRLSRPMRDGFGWVIGTSYLHNSARLTRTLGPVDATPPSTGVVNTVEEETLFGEASVEPLHGLTLTGGGRLTHSRLTGHPLDPGQLLLAAAKEVDTSSRSETKFLPSFSASVEPGRGVILFARYQQGFRPGGLGIGNYMIQRFRSDRVATMETGVRWSPPGSDRFSLAASVAHTDWRHVQADFLDALGLPVTTNIGDGRIWSFDMRAVWRPIPELRLEGSFIVNNSKLTRPDAEGLRAIRLFAPPQGIGQPLPTVTEPASLSAVQEVERQLPNVAELGGRVGVDYRHVFAGGLELTTNGWARYIGKSRLGVGPVLGGTEGNYVDTGWSARLGRGKSGVTLSITNLLDTAGNRFALGTPLDVQRGGEITPLQPRTVRLGFDTHF